MTIGKPLINKKERRNQMVAYHEAGHAVAFVILGEDFDFVTVIADDGSSGHVASTRPPEIVEAWNGGSRRDDPRVAQWVEHEVIHTLAGTAAQRLFFPRCHWSRGHGSVKNMNPMEPTKGVAQGSDLQAAIHLVNDLHSDDEEVAFAYYAYCRERARSLVQVHRDKINLVAKALMKTKTLSSDEVRRIMFPEATALFEMKERFEMRR
jgi:ATP-dependent Zn protease